VEEIKESVIGAKVSDAIGRIAGANADREVLLHPGIYCHVWRRFGDEMWRSDVRIQDTPKNGGEPNVPIGMTARALRRERAMTLKAAASACSASAATLSRIESETLSPTFAFLSSICAGFGISVHDFLTYGGRQKISGWRTLTRAGTGKTLETGHYHVNLLCDDMVHERFIVLRSEVLCRSIEEFGPPQSHTGQDQILVQVGRAKVRVGHYAPLILEPGDSLAFNSALDHAVISLDDTPVVILWICDLQRAEPWEQAGCIWICTSWGSAPVSQVC
jgi:transcriptional regulator with XRE-family HTH domain